MRFRKPPPAAALPSGSGVWGRNTSAVKLMSTESVNSNAHAFFKRHASKSVLTVNISGRNGASFAEGAPVSVISGASVVVVAAPV